MEHEATKQYLENLQGRVQGSQAREHTLNQDSKKHLPMSWAIALFRKLQVAYPHQWSSAYPTDEIVDEALGLWSEVLSGVTGEQIRHGLQSLPSEFIPSAMAFRKLCTGDDGLHKSGAYKPFENDASLTRIQHKVDRTAGRAKVAELRKLINK